MTNGWTGGQYSLYRAVFGLYLFVHFATLLPEGAELFSNAGALPSGASPFLKLFPNVLALNDTPFFVSILISVGATGAIGFSLGLYDRAAAVSMAYILTCLFGRDARIAASSLPFTVWLLLMHAMLPPAPYGSWSARGRTDPRGGWRMPPALFAAAWGVLSAAYAYSAYRKIASGFFGDLLAAPTGALQLVMWAALGLEFVYAPLALFRRIRAWIWTAMLGIHVALIILTGATEPLLGMVFVHLFTFDPQWVPARWSERRDQFFYDGTCGLCHRATRFVLAEDRGGTAFTFAPLQGDTFAAAFAVDRRTALPDSVVVRTTENGEVLTRSDAAIYILQRLGGLWRLVGAGLSLAPGALLNAAYDFVARIRYRLFARETTLCPVLPADLRSRFRS